jgi:excisionase family DNA binding protein
MNERQRFEIGQVLTCEELAEYLNIHAATVRKLVNQGQIPAFRVGDHWRFRLDAMKDWMTHEQK